MTTLLKQLNGLLTVCLTYFDNISYYTLTTYGNHYA